MSPESDLVPHLAHSIRAPNLRPMVKEVLYLNLFIVVSCLVSINLSHNNLPYEQPQRWLKKLKRPRKGHFPL